MTIFEGYKSFYTDKQGFFSQVNSINGADARVSNDEHNYRFLADNRVLIEQEFNQMFTSLKKNGTDRDEFWLYCYYCSKMLERYYAANLNAGNDPENQPQQVKDYQEWSDLLRHRYLYKAFPAEPVDLRTLQTKIATDLGKLVSTPKHTSKINDWLGFVNIYRILCVFSRLATKQSLLFARELQWFDKLEQLIGRHTDVDGMVSVINSPAPIFNALSVAFFAARFIVNSGVILKHTFAPSEAEEILSMSERFCQEVNKLHCVLLNDVVWGTINGLTNYAAYFNMSGPVANGLTAGFLVFDVSLLLYRRHLAEQEYKLKRAQYEGEKIHYNALMSKPEATLDEMKRYQKHYNMLEEQIKQLDITWQTTCAKNAFNVAAAAMLMGGFSASLLMALPAAVTVSYFVCTIAVAMYLTADIYGNYKEKSLIFEQCERESRKGIQALQEVEAARNDFIFAMVKNTVMPLLIVTTFAVCWEAALLLSALYIGYENCSGYFKKPSQKAPEPDEVDARLLVAY